MYIEHRNLRGVQKFVDTKVAPLVLWITIFYVGVEVIERNKKKCRIYAA